MWQEIYYEHSFDAILVQVCEKQANKQPNNNKSDFKKVHVSNLHAHSVSCLDFFRCKQEGGQFSSLATQLFWLRDL